MDNNLHSPIHHSPPPHARRTLGFLAGNLHMGIAPRLWPGMIAAVQKNDVNLFCFPGGSLHPVGEFDIERSATYNLVNVDRFDGLVSSGSTAPGGLDPVRASAFLQQYYPLPIVSLTWLPGEIPHVTMNSYQGMQAIVRHLIQTHGLRRLAFVRGPENHYYAQERYRAYVETLQELGLPVDSRLVTPPLPWEAGDVAIRILLDEHKLRPGNDLQAIVTVSDLAALNALKTLQTRGIQVPDDLALTGFNDLAEGRWTTPPLTTVSLPFSEQGEKVIEVLVSHLAGQTMPQQLVLPARLVVRSSCGCLDQSLILADLAPSSPGKAASEKSLADLCAGVSDEMARVMENSRENLSAISQLALALSTDLQEGCKTCFLPTMEKILLTNAKGLINVSEWHDVISIFRRHCLPYLDHDRRIFAENLFGQARLMIGRIAQRTQALKQLQAERQAETLRELGQALITTFDATRLADMLAERLPSIGIASCYLALYERPSNEFSRLILAYTEQGRVDLGSEGQRFPSRELVPPQLLPNHRQYSYVVEPLFFQHEQLGFAVFEAGELNGAVYELLRAQISSALKGALLLQEAQEARQVAEKADRIKTRLLANVSHELRTPLNIILDHSKEAVEALNSHGITPPPTMLDNLEHIRKSASHQLRVINDLLDLSRAEIDELDLYLELFDPLPILNEIFSSISHSAPDQSVTWRLQVPDRLPLLRADPVRLRQIIINLLSNARKFTDQGEVVLGAQIEPPHMHLWVQDTGTGISPDLQERIFEPFVVAEHAGRRLEGIGLGLSITRRLVALHNGSMNLNSQPGIGSTFHVYLPLPNLAEKTTHVTALNQPVMLLISGLDQPSPEMIEFSQRQGLVIQKLRASDDLDVQLSSIIPAALAWDLAGASPADWDIVRRLRNHPHLNQSPFILYGQSESSERSVGTTGVVIKPTSTLTLSGLINALCPKEMVRSILIVDDDPTTCQAHRNLIEQGFPSCLVRVVNDGVAAMAAMEVQAPGLVLLDLMMPEMDGFEVLDRMRADPRLHSVPVVILTNKVLSLDDIKRIEQHARVIVQNKGILTDDEIVAALHRSLFGNEALPPQTSALVKRAIAYMHQNYARPLARWEVAKAIGVSENYLSRVFNQDLGLSPWDYLTRFRINQAKELFRHTQGSVKSIAGQVGFKDQKYFSRIFHKLTGISPIEFKEQLKP